MTMRALNFCLLGVRNLLTKYAVLKRTCITYARAANFSAQAN